MLKLFAFYCCFVCCCFLPKSFEESSLPWISRWRDKMSMRFITPTRLNCIPNSIQINWKLCEIFSGDVFAYSYSRDVESRLIRLVTKVECYSIYHHPKFEPNRFINVRMHAIYVKGFLLLLWRDQQNSNYFTCSDISFSKVVSGFSAEFFHNHIRFHRDELKTVGENETNVLLCANIVTHRQGEGQWKWLKIIEVNGTYKHGM